MPWAARGKRKYFYRSRRAGGLVVKDYLGTGPAAELATADIARRRADRKQARAERKADRERWAQVEATLNDLDRVLRALVHARLKTLGYNQHARGRWRKKRHEGPQP